MMIYPSFSKWLPASSLPPTNSKDSRKSSMNQAKNDLRFNNHETRSTSMSPQINGVVRSTSTDQPRVVLHNQLDHENFKVRNEDITSIICHRHNRDGFEQYLARWEFSDYKDSRTPHSWHNLVELSNCLAKVQKYLDSFPSNKLLLVKRKRVSELPDDSNDEEVINGVLTRQDGIIKMVPASTAILLDQQLPTEYMKLHAAESDTRQALFAIRNAFDRNLLQIFVAPLEIINQIDGSRPPLDFDFIEKSRLGTDVFAAPPATMIGCGNTKRKAGPGGAFLACSPNMGQQVGCEYSRVCECLEFAAVDETRVKTEEDSALSANGETENLPKRFPYHTRTGLLTEYYLDRRNCIYECNPRCRCGPGCRTRVVQKGRSVPLQIFKTKNRGWGLRCTEDLEKGQFIDTYRGEIITDSEAAKREEDSDLTSGLKASYLYDLDKHVGQGGLKKEDCYVVDGEFMGGPTRFLNHSCDPNVRQYTVSYNKYDNRIYELAFFTSRRITAMEELTFDYMDKEEDENENDEDSDLEILDEVPDIFKHPRTPNKEQIYGTTRMKCLCGSANCRRTLWM